MHEALDDGINNRIFAKKNYSISSIKLSIKWTSTNLQQSERIKQEIERLTKMISSLCGHLATAKVAVIMPDIDVYACAKYILKEGTKEEKRDLLGHVRTELVIIDGAITSCAKRNK